MLERLTKWTIGQIFPTLPAGTDLARLAMNKRAKNALTRFGYYTMGDLQSLELADLLDLPQVGIGTVDSILQALAGASTLGSASALLIPDAGQARRPITPRDPGNGPTGNASGVIDDLETVARWYAALGMQSHPLLDTPMPPGSPPEVTKAWERLKLISAEEVLGQAGIDVANLLQRWVSMLDDRAQEIMARRFFADQPQTLDSLAQDLGVTRERVRQIEATARAELSRVLESSDPVGAVNAAVRELVGTVLPLADLLGLIPALAHRVLAVDQPAWRVLDRLDDAYEIKDGWCASPTVLSAQTETMTRLQEHANRHGVASVDDLYPLNLNQPEESAFERLRDWLSYCGFMVESNYVFTRVQSVSDRAAAILSVTGSPMSSQEILDRLGVERSLGSLRNAMASDDRFERVDRDKWALPEWGLESYSGVRAVMRQEIARDGGQVPMETLIERVTGRYSVSASSVISYASAPPFETRSGIVRLATGDRDARKSPERTRRLYRNADGWLYRVMVTKEHLRGSGSQAPVALAAILGLQHGQVRQLHSALGTQTISWISSQPTFGTIRRFLVDGDIETGSEVFLVIGDDGSFRIAPINAGDPDPLRRALILAGATDPAALQHPRAALATAIGLPKESPAASVIGGYRERGDTDIAELLLSIRDQLKDPPAAHQAVANAEIDEIMDLL
jgi:hypothetical protein